jgi:type IX secretion system PorP/SprF family membrane protein
VNAGYVFSINDQVKLKPSVLFKYQKAAPLEGDINVNVFLNDVLGLGVSYRTGDAILALVEYQVNTRIRVGYSFDYTTSKLSKFNSGSHEIMLSYDFGEDIIKMKTPRYF